MYTHTHMRARIYYIWIHVSVSLSVPVCPCVGGFSLCSLFVCVCVCVCVCVVSPSDQRAIIPSKSHNAAHTHNCQNTPSLSLSLTLRPIVVEGAWLIHHRVDLLWTSIVSFDFSASVSASKPLVWLEPARKRWSRQARMFFEEKKKERDRPRTRRQKRCCCCCGEGGGGGLRASSLYRWRARGSWTQQLFRCTCRDDTTSC